MPNPRHWYGPRPRKELGQHFLVDEEIASHIVEALHLNWEDRVLEIGPGRGVLLRFLLKASRQVTAVELDPRLRPSLQRTFGGHPGLNLIFDDFLRFDLVNYLAAAESAVKLVGNIPYSLSSPILFRLFETTEESWGQGSPPLKTAILMLQREVAQRICSEPGSRAYGGITVFRALVARAELLFSVPPGAFSPPPKVTSAVVKLDFYPSASLRISDRVRFNELIHHVFAQRRKMLKNTLGGLYWIPPAWKTMAFDFSRRPEELSAADFVQLFDQIVTS